MWPSCSQQKHPPRIFNASFCLSDGFILPSGWVQMASISIVSGFLGGLFPPWYFWGFLSFCIIACFLKEKFLPASLSASMKDLCLFLASSCQSSSVLSVFVGWRIIDRRSPWFSPRLYMATVASSFFPYPASFRRWLNLAL